MKKIKDEKERKFKFSRIYIEITNSCNLDYNDCYMHNKEKRYMTINEFSDIIDKIHNYTDIVYLNVMGEPLLNDNLDNFLRICETYNLKVNITTNGILLEKWLDVFIEQKSINQINISLNTSCQNEQIDIKKYLEYIFDLVEIIKKQTNIKISYRIWNVNETVEDSINRKILKAIEKFYKVSKIEKRAQKEKFIEIKNNIFLNQDYKFGLKKMDQICDTGKCYGLRNQMAILIDGTIVPCNFDINGEIDLGNIFYIKDLEEVIKSDKAKKIVEGFKRREVIEELCKRCPNIKI